MGKWARSLSPHKFQIKVESMEENKGGVSHFVAFANFTLIKKSIFKGKRRRIRENSNYISPCKNNIIFFFKKKIPLKETQQNPSRDYYNSIRTNLKFQHKPKISSFKNPHIK